MKKIIAPVGIAALVAGAVLVGSGSSAGATTTPTLDSVTIQMRELGYVCAQGTKWVGGDTGYTVRTFDCSNLRDALAGAKRSAHHSTKINLHR